ncbi:MAG: thioredoxin [Spirochaetota bacterium]
MPFDVEEANFSQDVIQRSHETPILVDFWAEWCGPCRMLTPVLEKLEVEANGSFQVAKVNTDENQNISLQYKISGIPAVKLFIDGEVKDEFTGALPERQIKQFLAKHILDPEEKAILALKESDLLAAANEVLAKNLHSDAMEDIVWSASLTALAQSQSKEQTLQYLAHIPEAGSKFSDSRNTLFEFLQNSSAPEDITSFLLLFEDGKEEEALQYFLTKVQNAGSNEKMQVKNQLLACFFVLGNAHPLVNQYRRKLSQALY